MGTLAPKYNSLKRTIGGESKMAKYLVAAPAIPLVPSNEAPWTICIADLRTALLRWAGVGFAAKIM
jgi:hypothetical protein